jgi:arylsulfatase A-like enzyme
MRVAPALVFIWLCSLCSLAACPYELHTERALTRGLAIPTVRPKPSAIERVQSSIVTASAEQNNAIQHRIFYALARHSEAAELRRDSTQLFDFGCPGDAKYTLGGWLTAVSETHAFDGRSALSVRGRSLKLALPADRADEQQLTLALRSFAPTSLTLLLNGVKLADDALQGAGFETLALSLPDGLLHAGENALELRVGPQSAGFELDWLALSSEPIGDPDAAPPDPASLTRPATPDTLTIPAGLRVGYSMQIPARAELYAQASSGCKAQLNVLAVREAEPDLLLAALDVDATPRPLRIALDRLEHATVRIDLAAEGCDVVLDAPTLSVAVPPEPQPALTRKPVRNVVLVLVDTLRADKLTPYNPQTRVQTPGLTRFLEGAAVMLHARSQETWTKPSVATLLSSLYPWQHNAVSDEAVLPEAIELLPETLSKHGFFTGAFIANGYISDKFGFKQGFDTYVNYIRENRRSNAQTVAADVLDWLDARPHDKPFFLYVHTIDPHVPYTPPKDFLKLYDAEPYAGPIDFLGGRGDLLEKIKIGHLPLEPRDKERLVALYDGEISYHDVHFAAIMAGLEKRGLADDTLVVLTADHGEEFWDHGSVGHGHSVYDELLHVPLIVRLPGVTQSGAKLAADVGLVDVAPTILEAVGQVPPGGMAGRSFLPELLGDAADAPRATVSGFMSGFRTVALGSFKLLQSGSDHFALYDTETDPGETQDIAANHPLIVRYLRGSLGLSLGRKAAQPSARAVYTAEKTAIDPVTEQQLRSLGYVGSSRH